jgi:hypothetical protein
MIESKIGNRGSKSFLINNLKNVKEQRVDGSYLRLNRLNNFNFKLRCTLMAFERNYHNNNLSKQLYLNKKNFSTINTDINP